MYALGLSILSNSDNFAASFASEPHDPIYQKN